MTPSPLTPMIPTPESKANSATSPSQATAADKAPAATAAKYRRPSQKQEGPRRKNCVGPGKSWIVSGRGLFR